MSKVTKVTIGLMIVTLISKGLGFIRELVLASAYGASAYSDAYLTAMNIEIVLFAIIGTAIGTTFIPMYFEVKNLEGEEGAISFTNNILNIIVILCIILAAFGYCFAEQLVKMFAIGFKGDTLNVAVKFTQVIVIGVIFTGLSYVMTGYLHAKNKFIVTGLVGIPKNIIIISSIFLSLKYGVHVMIIGALIGIATDFLIQVPFIKKNGYKYKLYINFKDKHIIKTIYLLGPILIGTGVNQINGIIDRTLASTLGEGSISALNYANRLNGFVIALFITTIASVIFPIFSKLAIDLDRSNLKKAIINCTNSIILLVVPISIFTIVFSKEIVIILFQRGKFDSTATNMTVIALIFYSIGMTALGLREILAKVFYSLKDTKTPMINGIITMILNIILNLVLVKYMGIAGLAFATSVSSIICTAMLFISLKKKIGNYGIKKVIITILKSLIAGIIMAIVATLLYNTICIDLNKTLLGEILSLGIAMLIGACVYFVSIILLKVSEVKIVTSGLRGLFRKVLNK